MKKILERELKHIYGGIILFFYYMKWPIVIGLPVLYLYLGYERNIFLDVLWVLCIILIIKDFVTMYLRYRRGEKIWK